MGYLRPMIQMQNCFHAHIYITPVITIIQEVIVFKALVEFFVEVWLSLVNRISATRVISRLSAAILYSVYKLCKITIVTTDRWWWSWGLDKWERPPLPFPTQNFTSREIQVICVGRRRSESLPERVPHGDWLPQRRHHLVPMRQCLAGRLRAHKHVAYGGSLAVYLVLRHCHSQLYRLEK